MNTQIPLGPGPGPAAIEALFVSDLHISGPNDEKYGQFLELLKFCLNHRVASVFLVGDIFDLWIADRPYFTERYRAASEAIQSLVRVGVRVHYFEGNHDLDLAPHWGALGVEVHGGATDFNLAGYVWRVEHGDEMDPDDRGYRFLRWLLRTPVVRWLGRHLSSRAVAMIGERASRTSRGYTSQIKTISEDEARARMRRHGERIQAERPFDVLVCGHTHVTADLALTRGRLINLGTWLERPAALVLRADGQLLFSDLAELGIG